MNTTTHQPDAGQLDTARIFATLLQIHNAPALSGVIAQQFQKAGEGDARVDEAAFAFLLNEEFISSPQPLAEAIAEYQTHMAAAEPIREEKLELERRFKSLAVRLKHAEKSRPLVPMFQSRKDKWEQANREGNIERERREIRQRQIKVEENLIVVRDAYERLLKRAEEDTTEATVRWYNQMPVYLSHHGSFLLDHLDEMESAHFQGRPLSEILVLGPMLA